MIIKPTEVEELQKNKKRTSSDGKNRSYLWLCSSDLLSWKMVVARSSMSTTTSSKIVKVSSGRVVVNFIFFLFVSFLKFPASFFFISCFRRNLDRFSSNSGGGTYYLVKAGENFYYSFSLYWYTRNLIKGRENKAQKLWLLSFSKCISAKSWYTLL